MFRCCGQRMGGAQRLPQALPSLGSAVWHQQLSPRCAVVPASSTWRKAITCPLRSWFVLMTWCWPTACDQGGRCRFWTSGHRPLEDGICFLDHRDRQCLGEEAPQAGPGESPGRWTARGNEMTLSDLEPLRCSVSLLQGISFSLHLKERCKM